jgi:hypothetical protein
MGKFENTTGRPSRDVSWKGPSYQPDRRTERDAGPPPKQPEPRPIKYGDR